MKRSFAFTLLGKTCLVVALIISGCTKDPNPAPAVPACKIVKRYQEGNPNIYWLYKYDDKGRISKYEQYEGNDRVSLTTYAYNSQDRIVKKTQEITPPAAANSYAETITCSYEYNSQGLATSYACSSNVTTGSTSGAFEYDVAGNLFKSNYVQTQGDKVYTQVKLFEHLDGNCIRMVDNPGSATETTTVYDYYLDKENKSKGDATQYMYGGSPSRNMQKKGTATSKDGISITNVFTYQYNEQGYPTREYVEYSFNNTTGSSAYLNQYECK